jgi:hypothetical protein
VQVRQWCVRTGNALSVYGDPVDTNPIFAVARSGAYLVGTRMDGFVPLSAPACGRHGLTVTGETPPHRMLLVWPDHDGNDAPSKPATPVVGAPAHEGCASCVATDGTVVATGGFDGIVRVWALEPPADAADGDGAVPHLRLVHRVWAPFLQGV